MSNTTTRTIRDLPPLSTNYMVRLKLENEALKAQLQSARDSMAALKDHCRGDKFASEPYINVTDVIAWLDQAGTAINDAESTTYAIARMRQVISESEPDRKIANNFFKLTAERVTSQSYEHAVYYTVKSELDFALEVLTADKWDSVELDAQMSSERWSYVRRVRLGYHPTVE